MSAVHAVKRVRNWGCGECVVYKLFLYRASAAAYAKEKNKTSRDYTYRVQEMKVEP